MSKVDQLMTELARTSVIIKGIGRREAQVDQKGQIFDLEGKNITEQVYPKKEKPHFEDGKRQETAKLAESLPTINTVLLNGKKALAAFNDMKQSLLNDLDLDSESLQELNMIEQTLNKFVSSYFEKKEQLRQFNNF